MARNWIVIGDPTSSGGSVVSGSPFTDIDGTPVARVTDQATCPRHKGAYPIVDGDSTLIVDGQPVALHGSSLACGCKVLSAQQVRVFVDAGGGAGGGTGGAQVAAAVAAGTALASAIATATGKDAAGDAPVEYDEALRFCSESGEPLAGMHYTLDLADGETCSGVTDENGVTGRVRSQAPVAIVRATIAPSLLEVSCCAVHPETDFEEAVFELDAVLTHSADIGVSVVEVKTSGHERELTSGEIHLARMVFGDAVAYEQVKVHDHAYWMTLGLQPKNTAMAPNGEIYFGRELYRDDYSVEPLHMQHLFVHEMTHVWQYQLGYPVKRVRIPRPRMRYDYELDGSKELRDFNMEAQGNILADYFLTAFRGSQRQVSQREYRTDAAYDALLQKAIRGFLQDPGDTRNLPITTR
ncbi:PAAR domain-containing protein [Luteimonas dalianensis]|uniref:PAAR domain-containing protein n=1 Tax=Luteimonas dalianensis TaxID=1148196 RepID=UPI003BF18E9B